MDFLTIMILKYPKKISTASIKLSKPLKQSKTKCEAISEGMSGFNRFEEIFGAEYLPNYGLEQYLFNVFFYNHLFINFNSVALKL